MRTRSALGKNSLIVGQYSLGSRNRKGRGTVWTEGRAHSETVLFFQNLCKCLQKDCKTRCGWAGLDRDWRGMFNKRDENSSATTWILRTAVFSRGSKRSIHRKGPVKLEPCSLEHSLVRQPHCNLIASQFGKRACRWIEKGAESSYWSWLRSGLERSSFPFYVRIRRRRKNLEHIELENVGGNDSKWQKYKSALVYVPARKFATNLTIWGKKWRSGTKNWNRADEARVVAQRQPPKTKKLTPSRATSTSPSILSFFLSCVRMVQYIRVQTRCLTKK